MTDTLCDCHGEPKFWHTDRRSINGGHWRCRVKAREYRRRYRQSEHGRETELRGSALYNASEAGQARRDRFEQSEKRRDYLDSRYHGDNFERWVRTRINQRRSRAKALTSS